VLGQVERVDESGTELTLTDGTTLLTPPGAMLRPPGGSYEQPSASLGSGRLASGRLQI
jgi:hypothetical protein